MTNSKPAATAAASPNRDCHCRALNRQLLRQHLQQQPDGDWIDRLLDQRPHLAAEALVFLDADSLRRQREIIGAIERTVAMPAYRQHILATASATSQHPSKAQGVFLGYDFHLGIDGPKLIEINSNAGGAMLNIELARATSLCPNCPGSFDGAALADAAEQAIIEMFRREWALFNPQRPLQSIAIVDQAPGEQYMLPEFLLFRNSFRRHGIEAIICDPGELEFQDGQLRHGNLIIDLVYNRLTDFALEQEQQRAIRAAYLADATVITPHPRNHALYADKRNLALLTNDEALADLGVDAQTREILLNGIANTELVNGRDAETLWQRRKQLFFKPARGYGGKAAYRGDKVTLKVFDEILHGDYVAQTLVPPSERDFPVGGEIARLKLDLRHYLYQGRSQWLCARLYQGQTTNFRTPGGGFAQVVVT